MCYKKSIEEANKLVINPVIGIPAAVAKFFTEASTNIYSKDSLKDETLVLIKVFHIQFYSTRDSIDLNFKDVEFSFKNDTLNLVNFVFPKWDLNKYSDTMRSVITCNYVTQKRPEIQCITREYKLVNGKVSPTLTLELAQNISLIAKIMIEVFIGKSNY